jgi:hypothetical protein
LRVVCPRPKTIFWRWTLDFGGRCYKVQALVTGRGGRPERVDRFPSGEAALCFDNMKTRRQETEARSQKPGMRGEGAVGAASGAWNPYGKWSAGVLEYWGQRLLGSGGRARNYAEKITGFYAFFRGFPRFYAQIRAVFTRFYAFLRVGLFFDNNCKRHAIAGNIFCLFSAIAGCFT